MNNKKLRELLQLKAEKVEAAETAINNGDKELANSLVAEIKNLTTEIDLIQNLNSLKHDDKTVDMTVENKVETGIQALKESTDENGGYLVPADVQTKINEYRRSFTSLRDYVDVRNVVVPSGSEVYEKTSQLTALTNITELAEIEEIKGSTFEKISYAVENLLAYLAKWFTRKQVITENKEILEVLNSFEKKAITKVDEIKTAMNVTLDPMFLDNTKFITNQSGFNILDTLKDKNNNYLLQPVVNEPTKRLLSGKEVVVLPDTHFPKETDGSFPLYVGDLHEAVRLYSLNALEILSTDVGGKAFTRNSYDTRLITRFDVKPVDKEAVVKLTFTKDLAMAVPLG